MTDLQPGWSVLSNDGKRLGSVKDVGQHYVRTSQAGSGADLYVPASAISNIVDNTVYLSIAHNDVRNMGWEQPPRTDDTLETSPEPDLDRHV